MFHFRYCPSAGVFQHDLVNGIQRIPPFLSRSTEVHVYSLIISRPDCCNSLLVRLPMCAIRPLQLIQNAGNTICLQSS